MALALILNTLWHVSDHHAAMPAGTEFWVKDFPGDIDVSERELTGRSVGIIGFGKVWKRLAQLLEPFECALWIVDPYVPDSITSAFGAKNVSLGEMLTTSDVVVLCAASNSGTDHLLGRDAIA